ncbi:hypothetical protein AB0B40_28285 [Streptomyces sp. NPDC042638]|uniref:hypothetical protein n=1 Tax=Streptomyces sp. NPDC042638 TaxID=3154333 RepID=UPI0033FE4A9D
MHRTLADDPSRLPELLRAARDVAAREVAGPAGRLVAAPGRSPGRPPLPAEGAGGEGALARFADRCAPDFSGSAGPAAREPVPGGGLGPRAA